MLELMLRRLESVVVEANVVIQRVEDIRSRCLGYVPEDVTDKLNEGAQQIQMDVAALVGLRKEREKKGG